MKTYPLRISGTCPICDVNIFFDESWSFEDVDKMTTDCSNCGSLLIVKGKTVYPFHEKTHLEDPRWPKDGKGTDFVVIEA